MTFLQSQAKAFAKRNRGSNRRWILFTKHLGVANPHPNDDFVFVKTLMQMFGTMLRRVFASE